MENLKLGFEDFIAVVDEDNKGFVEVIHDGLTKYGCKTEVKSASRGYLVSYILNKKVLINFVFRKNGLIIRIYANNVANYEDILETFNDEMRKSIINAPICKRLVDPTSCNSKCAMGYDFMLNGSRMQKCRSNAFMFLLNRDNNKYIKLFLANELKFVTIK